MALSYTISQVAEKTCLSIHAIRYYEKEGLLPFIDRRHGARIFHTQDIDWIDLICCLKNTGMPIKEIRAFVECCNDQNAVMESGLQILLRHKRHVEQQLKDMQRNLETIQYKIDHLPQLYAERFVHAREGNVPTL